MAMEQIALDFYEGIREAIEEEAAEEVVGLNQLAF